MRTGVVANSAAVHVRHVRHVDDVLSHHPVVCLDRHLAMHALPLCKQVDEVNTGACCRQHNILQTIVIATMHVALLACALHNTAFTLLHSQQHGQAAVQHMHV